MILHDSKGVCDEPHAYVYVSMLVTISLTIRT